MPVDPIEKWEENKGSVNFSFRITDFEKIKWLKEAMEKKDWSLNKVINHTIKIAMEVGNDRK